MMKLKNSWQSKAVREVERIATPSAFRPHRLLRGGRIQTLASSYAPRNLSGRLTGEQVVILDAGRDYTGYDEKVRLMGYYNRHSGRDPSRGLVISLHGWEGSSHSSYNLLLGSYLLTKGYDLFRLNLRDHGPRLHVDPYMLNRGAFFGTLIEETMCAVQQVAAWAGDLPVYLVGPSLGGNFVLRLAVLHAVQPIANLRRVVAISPAINPARSIERIDQQIYFRRYFRKRWLRTLLAKERHFPDLYQFGPLRQLSYIEPMSQWLIKHYSNFADTATYYASYAVLGDALAGLTVPTTILTAADDPVIMVEDFETLVAPPLLDLKIEQFGGHVGFVDWWPLHHHLPEMVEAALQRE